MKAFKILAIAGLGLVLAACAHKGLRPGPEIKTLTVHASVRGNSIEIDERKHHEVELGPGDFLVWTLDCSRCPEGTELAITEIRQIADLTALKDDAERERVRKAAKNGSKDVYPDYGSNTPETPGAAFKLPPMHASNNKRVVLSKPYRQLHHDHLWAFTWVVTAPDLQGDQWDPHFSGRR